MDEKTALGEKVPLISRASPKRNVKARLVTVLGLLATLSAIHLFYHHPIPSLELADDSKNKDGPPSWSWTDVEPSRDLVWSKCYDDEFECARLDVAMDWLDPTDAERVVLGVIKLAAKEPQSSLPPVFVNPGGPGGSGISFVRKAGSLLQTIVGNNHDIISFDPRGVGVSTPRVECWGASQKRKLWAAQGTPLIDERPGLVYDAYARAMAYTNTCELAMNHTGIMRHLSTASLATDMLAILNGTGHEKLRYWGFSYGTVLGGVFAGLYPDRVERLVSDGNCDYHDWFKLDHVNFLSDTDLIFDAFDTFCHKAGPEKCSFWDSSPKAIQTRRRALLDSLKRSPVLIPAWSRPTGPELPELITYSKLQEITRQAAYKPLTKFPGLSDIYAALENGDGMPYYEMIYHGGDELVSEELCSLGDTPATMPQETGMEEDAYPSIMCSDNEPLNETPDEFAEYAERLLAKSVWVGAANIDFRVSCLGRKVRPKWRFTEDNFTRGDTAHPILFIGNMADNVTPLESAFNNSARFPSSVVLKQNSYGHCSLAAASTCTVQHIRTYFQNGTLPAKGTECEPDYDLFQLPPESQEVREMDELTSAVLRLAREVDVGF